MIRETLNKTFVLDQLQSALAVMKERSSSNRSESKIGSHEPQLDRDDYKQAAAEVAGVLTAETAAKREANKAAADQPPATARGSLEAEDICFISSDPIVSITQSALDYYFEQRQDKALPRDVDDGLGAVVTPRTLGLPAKQVSKRRILDKFSVTDPGWVSSLIAMGISKFRKKHPFNPNPAPPRPIADRCRIVMVGDWGSGLPRAQKVARQMRTFVTQSIAEGVDCHVVHLGDVYYSGYEYEYRDRFLRYWPVEPGEQNRVASWSLNGNHDMYTGGHDYYGTLLADERFAAQGRSSFFRLFNTHWQFVGLDTAYEDNGLMDPQAGWLAETLKNNDRRTILLTHHQFFSVFEDAPSVGKVLRDKLGPLLAAGRIHGAIWGHEHRCVIHAPHDNLVFPRLLGHGGVPVYMMHSKYEAYPFPATFEDRRFMQKDLESWAYMGFAVFDLDGPRMKVRYLDENGEQQYEEITGEESVS